MPNTTPLSPETRLTAIIDGTRAGTWEWNLTTGEVIINQRWAEMLGYGLDEFTPMTYELWESISHPEDRIRAKQLMSRHLRGQTPFYDCIVRMLHRDGHWRWIHTRGRKLDEVTPEGVWMFGTHLDITEERQTQHRLQRLAESLPGVIYIFVLDSDGRFHFPYVSNKSIDFYGVPPEVTMQDPSAIFDIIVNEDLPLVRDSITRSAETLGEWRCEYRVQVRGAVRWMEGVAQPEREEGGRIVWHGMVMDVTERKNLELELARLSVTDELTGLYNRRYMLRSIEEQIARAERYDTDFSVISLDIDHFKQINDSYGHLVGDEVLRQFAEMLLSRVRRTDIVARTGGEEFLVLLPDSDGDSALSLAESLREATLNETFRTEDDRPFTISMSCGVVTWHAGLGSMRELLSLCDQSLYDAKHQGRNRVVIAPQD